MAFGQKNSKAVPAYPWVEMARVYLFFAYFTCLTPLLILIRSSGASGFVPLRQALLLSTLWLIPVLFAATRVRQASAVIGFALWLSSLFGLCYFFVYGQEFSQSVIFIIFESNLTESSEYAGQYFVWWMIPAVLVYSALGVWLWRGIRAFSVQPKQVVLSLLIIVVTLFGYPLAKQLGYRHARGEVALAELANRFQRATPWDLAIGYVRYRAILADMQALLKQSAHLPPLENLRDANGEEPRTLVLVIGESTNRQHMSLYGYGRTTTPRLDSMRDELAVFRNVVAPRPYTIETLQQVLTFADQEHPDLYRSKPSLMNLMKQAGYKSYWITNQQTMTERNTMLTTFSKQTDVQVYLNNRASQDVSQFDNSVFEPFDEALKDPAPKKFIVVHLLGAHMKYRYRYPADYEHFVDRQGGPHWLKDSQLSAYNQYDNAVLFNDFVVSSLIEKFAATRPNGLLTYFSDHGEDVFDSAGHDFNGRNETAPTYPMYAIPFLVWTSPQWKSSHRPNYRDYLDRPYSTMDFIHTWSDLAGISYDGFEPAKSVVNQAFKERPLWIGNPDIPKSLIDLRLLNK